ncbi:hypothetical protein AAC387_Pa03g1845 [Persea americana]
MAQVDELRARLRSFEAPVQGTSSCNFFKWCDNVTCNGVPNVAQSSYPTCSCGAGKCILLTEKDGKDAVGSTLPALLRSLEERPRAEKRNREANGYQFTPRWFSGTALDVLKVMEDGDLQTLGMLDYDKRLSHSFTAHPKIDPFTTPALPAVTALSQVAATLLFLPAHGNISFLPLPSQYPANSAAHPLTQPATSSSSSPSSLPSLLPSPRCCQPVLLLAAASQLFPLQTQLTTPLHSRPLLPLLLLVSAHLRISPT